MYKKETFCSTVSDSFVDENVENRVLLGFRHRFHPWLLSTAALLSSLVSIDSELLEGFDISEKMQSR